jgi:hypothetical protein
MLHSFDRRLQTTNELCNFNSPSNIAGMIKSRRMRSAGNVLCMGEMRNVYKILAGKSKGNRPLGRLCTDKIILKWFLG